MSKKSKWRVATSAKSEQVAVDDERPIRAGQRADSQRLERAQKRAFYDDEDQLLNSGGRDNEDEDQEHDEYHRLISTDLHHDGLESRRGKSLADGLTAHANSNQTKQFEDGLPWRRGSLIILIGVLTVCACGLFLMLRSPLNEWNLFRQADPLAPRHQDAAHRKQLEQDQGARWLVSTPKCHIPLLEPWDKSIESYVERKGPMNCSLILDEITSGRSSSKPNNWTGLRASSVSFVESNKLFFTEAALERGALTSDQKAGQCCFKRVSRAIADDNLLEQGRCEPITSQGLSVDSSVIEVICAAWNYTNVHSFVVHNQAEEAALARVGREKLSPDGDFYSVLMIGVDTISRLNGRRQLNQTLETLRELYGALNFVGYNKVGENTFPNLIPLLTGFTPEQLTEIQCWEAKNYAQNESGDDYLDNCKFLWNYYQQIGYLTYLSEDWPSASTFNYLKPGFKYEPTAFYGRPFTLAREHLVYPTWKQPGCAKCQLDRPLVEVDLANLRAFIENNDNKLPYLAFHWFNCPQHDDLNGASQVDHLFEGFFRDFAQRLENDRAFVIFFSDHGYRWDDFVSTRVGHYESSLPLLTIAPPKAFIERHPELYERMKSHQKSLLTPFDMFKTLIDLKELSSGGRKTMNRDKRAQQLQAELTSLAAGEEVTILPESNVLNGLAKTTINPNKTEVTDANTKVNQLRPIDATRFKQNFTILSLFDQHTAEQLDRGCIDAGIPDNYCVCHQFQAIATDSLDVLGAAYYLVYAHLEARLRDHLDICHYLDLERVHSAEMYNFTTGSSKRGKTRRKRSSSSSPDQSRPNMKTSTKTTVKHLHGAGDDQSRHNYLPQLEYSIMLSTKPGGGLFSEVVRYYGANMTNCKLEVEKTRNVIEDGWATETDKHESVLTMNDECNFSVHSTSISRLNLYGSQSKCVKSDIELKKICCCRENNE